jgi:hypothetical protein
MHTDQNIKAPVNDKVDAVLLALIELPKLNKCAFSNSLKGDNNVIKVLPNESFIQASSTI